MKQITELFHRGDDGLEIHIIMEGSGNPKDLHKIVGVLKKYSTNAWEDFTAVGDVHYSTINSLID